MFIRLAHLKRRNRVNPISVVHLFAKKGWIAGS
jgi:hypothetical protein